MTTPLTPDASSRDRFWMRVIAAISVVLVGAIALLTMGPRPETLVGTVDVSWMPHLNGAMNTGTSLSLLAALVFIRRKNIPAHKASILTAFGFTMVFLVSYVVYHTFKPGPVVYEGDYRGLYLFILLSHITLAPVVVPAALVSLYRGWMDQREKHKKLVRWTWPLWFYVGVTGVLVYVFLYM
ncbi:MAG: putative membrane protein [Myxococcota bacterium]|jgi:putative membrane protein